MISCGTDDLFDPWALAEGVVDGKRKSVLLRVEPTAEHGVYTFQRRWPEEGQWMIRFNLGHPPAPATVVTLGRDGSVRKNKLHRRTDGSPECGRALRPLVRGRGRDRAGTDDGC